jgi:hypothetical protein
MAMQLTLTNLFQFFSTLSPLLLGFFIISATILNQNIKGFIWLAGVLIAFIFISNIVYIYVIVFFMSSNKTYKNPSWA